MICHVRVAAASERDVRRVVSRLHGAGWARVVLFHPLGYALIVKLRDPGPSTGSPLVDLVAPPRLEGIFFDVVDVHGRRIQLGGTATRACWGGGIGGGL